MPDLRSCSMQMCRFHRMPLGGFYRIVDAAYERRAMAVSTNLHPSGFDGIMPKTLATATVDRLLHRPCCHHQRNAKLQLTVLLAPPGIGEVGPVIVEDDLLDNTLNSPLLVEGWSHP